MNVNWFKEAHKNNVKCHYSDGYVVAGKNKITTTPT